MPQAIIGGLITASIGEALAIQAILGSVTASYVLGGIVAAAVTSQLFKPSAADDANLNARGLKTNKQGSDNPIPVICGVVRTGGTIAYLGTADTKNEELNLILGIGEGKLDIEEVYLNDVAYGDLIDKKNKPEHWEWRQGLGNRLVYIDPLTWVVLGEVELDDYGYPVIGRNSNGTERKTAYAEKGQKPCSLAQRDLPNNNASWGDDYRLDGTAYVYVRYRYDSNNFPVGVPAATVKVRRKNDLYDPREKSQYFPEGFEIINGEKELRNQGITDFHSETTLTVYQARIKNHLSGMNPDSTDSPDYGRGDNPILLTLDYLINENYGRKIDLADIDLETFKTEANYCSERLLHSNGQMRFTANGVIDTNVSPLNNVKRLLSSCMGALIFTGGKYKVVIDKPQDFSGIVFDENNIIGEWNILLEGKKDLLNRVKADYIDENGDAAIAIVDAKILRETKDNNLLLEKTIRLPFTNTSDRVKRIATVVINQSRNQFKLGLTVAVTAETLKAEPGDVVAIRHEVPGWEDLMIPGTDPETNSPYIEKGKLFTIIEANYKPNVTIEFKLLEYQRDSFDVGNIIADDTQLDTTYPAGLVVEAPTDAVLENSQYFSTRSSGLKNSVKLSWQSAQDFSVLNYYVEYRKTFDANEDGSRFDIPIPEGETAPYVIPFVAVTTTSTLTTTVFDIDQGFYDFNIFSLTATGVRSSSPLRVENHPVLGKLDPPSALTGLTLSILNNVCFVSWDIARDLDVLIGGEVRVKHSFLNNGWDSATAPTGTIPGSATTTQVPAEAGYYYAKFIDASGKESVNAAVKRLTTVPSITKLNAVLSVVESPLFAGNNIYLDGGSGANTRMTVQNGLLSVSGDATNLDRELAYRFEDTTNLGSLVTVRLLPKLDSVISEIDGGNTMDQRGVVNSVITDLAYIDNFNPFDGLVTGNGKAVLWFRATTRNPVGLPDDSADWSEWKRFNIRSDETAWGFQFRLIFSSISANSQISVSGLSVDVDMPDRVLQGSQNSSQRKITVSYSTSFYSEIPFLGITASNLESGDYYEITEQTTHGFGIIFKNALGIGVIRRFSYYARGF